MPTFGPIKRPDLIRYLRELGFEGPFSGSRHQYMVKDDITVRIPNPHKRDISKGLVAEILRQAGIDRDEWEQL
ncbi:MAG: type II toxin-antitoxin system HicA family toxin [Nostoc sp.]|jgi:predicted RNA binding protein YcfA (HicA-like mRNA interferase family)|uniref:type II toxin-antitoxin system HicA family toxin n=1 Tax=Nostoc sp. TaxID=1180 RepID=UPI002FF6460D